MKIYQHGYDNLQYCPYVDMVSLYSHFQDYTFGCNTKVQYIKQNVQYNEYPKIHHFSYIKWDSIPKYNPKYHIKWGLHTNIEYNTMKYHVHTLKRVSSI